MGEADAGARVDQVLDGTSASPRRPPLGRYHHSHQRPLDQIPRIADRDRRRISAGRPRAAWKSAAAKRSSISRPRWATAWSAAAATFRTGWAAIFPSGARVFPRPFNTTRCSAPANAAGPLVDLDGRVVGINIARAERVASYAIPTPVVLDVIDELMPRQVAREQSPSGSRTGRVTAARPGAIGLVWH